jgi:hypothetical protein
MQTSKVPRALHENRVKDVALIVGMREKVRAAAAAKGARVIEGRCG